MAVARVTLPLYDGGYREFACSAAVSTRLK
jgi:hypothetical protein